MQPGLNQAHVKIADHIEEERDTDKGRDGHSADLDDCYNEDYNRRGNQAEALLVARDERLRRGDCVFVSSMDYRLALTVSV